MKTLSRHMLVELFGCSPELIDDLDVVRAAVLEAIAAVGATPLAEAFHRYTPQGVSGTVLIAESHVSVHTWPEHGYAAMDLFTCGGLDPRPGAEVAAAALGAGSHTVRTVLRGLPEHLAEAESLQPGDVKLVDLPLG